MDKFHNNKFPHESEKYRKARNELLIKEIDLRKQLESIAALRRNLPLGGKLKNNYVFQEGASDLSDKQTIKDTRFSELFETGKNCLFIYSFMYDSEAKNPCPMCTSILDGLNGNAPHLTDRLNFVVVAKASSEKIRDWARERGWHNLRLLSSGNNTYNLDYFAEHDEWGQMPAMNVFQKTEKGIFHFYSSELLYAPAEKGQHARHADLIWPLWNIFDLTPEGRGSNWFPKIKYDTQ